MISVFTAFVMFEREVKLIHIFELTVLLPCLHITSNIYMKYLC